MFKDSHDRSSGWTHKDGYLEQIMCMEYQKEVPEEQQYLRDR